MKDTSALQTLGKELEEYRKRKGLSQSQISDQLGVSQAQVSRIEKGKSSIPDNIISKIKKLLKKPLSEYLFKIEIKEDKYWRCAFHVHPEKYSGDRIEVFNKNYIL